MTEWITQREAAEILGVHRSAIGKLVANGELTSQDAAPRRPCLDRAGALARAKDERARREAEWARSRAEREVTTTYRRPPDNEHEWLSIRQVADLLGVSRVAVRKRCRRGRLPYAEHGQQLWIPA